MGGRRSEAFDIDAAEKEINEAVALLSDSAQQAFAEYDKDQNLEAPAYKTAVEEFYAKNVWRRPVKADLEVPERKVRGGG